MTIEPKGPIWDTPPRDFGPPDASGEAVECFYRAITKRSRRVVAPPNVGAPDPLAEMQSDPRTAKQEDVFQRLKVFLNTP